MVNLDASATCRRDTILDLDTMKILDSGSGFPLCRRVRRLSNSSNTAHNSYFPEKWKFYRFNIDKDETDINDWEEYSTVRESTTIKLAEKSCNVFWIQSTGAGKTSWV